MTASPSTLAPISAFLCWLGLLLILTCWSEVGYSWCVGATGRLLHILLVVDQIIVGTGEGGGIVVVPASVGIFDLIDHVLISPSVRVT